jgi:hypothetical protein
MNTCTIVSKGLDHLRKDTEETGNAPWLQEVRGRPTWLEDKTFKYKYFEFWTACKYYIKT